MTFTLKTLSEPLLGSDTWQSIASYFQPNMEPVQCEGNFDLLTFELEIMTFIVTFLSGWLLGNYTWQLLLIFINITLTLNLCTGVILTFNIEIITFIIEILFENYCLAQLKGIQYEYYICIRKNMHTCLYRKTTNDMWK